MHDGIIMCFDHTLNWKSSYFAKDALSLALDCNSSTNSICSSYSDGKVLVFSVERAEPMAKFKVSEYEAWTCAFDRWNENLVYSGADDGGFCGWDIRSAEPAFRNLKSHSESGVVSVQSSPFTEHIVATGGYDEKLRIWDARKGFSSEMQVSKIAPNGGVWKIKWHPHDSHTLGIACMYAGLKIIRLKDDYSITEESHFAPNENSLVYGVDWNRCDSNILASCSFYDKRLRIWRRS
jgi:diphthamide biosynthesis protein 7